MNTRQRGQLVEALLQCSCMSNRNTRNTVIGDLREDIQRNVVRSTIERDDVANTVKTCLNYSYGLEELITIVRRFEGRSIPMEAVDNLILDIYDFDIRLGTKQNYMQFLAVLSNVDLPGDELKQVYRSILPSGVEERDEPLGLFAMTSHLWNLSRRPEGRTLDRTYPVIDWVEELARRTRDSGVATDLRSWANRIAPDLDQDSRRPRGADQSVFGTEDQSHVETERRLLLLSAVLSFHYPTIEEAGEIVASARLNPVNIEFREMAFSSWQNILSEAQKRGKVLAIIDAALADHSDDEWLGLAREKQKREQELRWTPAFAEEDEVLERIIQDHQPREDVGLQPMDLSLVMPIAYFERGLLAARSVARIVLPDQYTGTGFLIDDNLLVTAHHVLPDIATSEQAVVQFNYQRTPDALYAPVDEFKLTPEDVFLTSREDLWTVVRVQGNPNERWGALRLARTYPRVGDRIVIIQHPGGQPKQVGYFGSSIAFVGERRVQYLASTSPGSAGSPVFDLDWGVIAVHHSGGHLREPGSKWVYYRNEGTYINVVIDGLSAAGLYSEP